MQIIYGTLKDYKVSKDGINVQLTCANTPQNRQDLANLYIEAPIQFSCPQGELNLEEDAK